MKRDKWKWVSRWGLFQFFFFAVYWFGVKYSVHIWKTDSTLFNVLQTQFGKAILSCMFRFWTQNNYRVFLDKCTYRPKHYNWIPNIPKEPIITYPFTKECYNNSIINPNIFSIGQLKYLREQFAIGTISYWTTKSLLEFFKWLHFISHKIRFFVAHYSVTIT